MHSRFFRPASRRRFAAFGGPSLLGFWLVLMLSWAPVKALAHEGHDDLVPAASGTNALPRLTAKSDLYEVVAVLDGERLTIYLDRYADNSPVTNASISVLIDAETLVADSSPDGTYTLSSKLFRGTGSLELVFDIKAPDGDDLLAGHLTLASSSSAQGISNPVAWYAQPFLALRHAAQDHLVLVSFALLMGLVFGLALRHSRRRVSPLSVLLVTSVAYLATASTINAHEGHDHAEDSKAQTAQTRDNTKRLPDGKVFLPKPMQRILDIRTALAKTEIARKSVVLVGRVITNPNRSGVVQSISGGRITAPEGGLPRLGQAVAKDDILALVEPAMPIADRTTISERAGELEQLIAIAEAKLRRLRPLAERGVTPQAQIIDAEAELQGLYRRRDVVRETRIAPEVLRAPIDGIIATSRVVSGQVVQAQDILFQIVDPTTLWVEAFDYGEIDPTNLKHATAVGVGSGSIKLTFQGSSRTLQQQATVLQFEILRPPASIRVGQPVTVTVQQSESITGVIVSRDAVVRGPNGEAIVWRHVEAEQFEARPVRTEPFDAAHVLVAAGVADGDRLVVRGADMINQIR